MRIVDRPPDSSALRANSRPILAAAAAGTPVHCSCHAGVQGWLTSSYRYDKFAWTTRSSQLYERRLLRWASPMFHFGILVILLGHVMGPGVPKSWTEAVGMPAGLYHALAIGMGLVAGVCTVVGMALLIYRRRTVGPVFSATTRMAASSGWRRTRS